MAKKKILKVNSFFAGIGGFDIAFEREGFQTTYLCEIDEFCNKVLNRHWPNVQKGKDIRQVQSISLPSAHVWCGGFPCQDISVARGRNIRLGLEGERSGLFYDYANLIEQCQPEVVVIENVEGLFSSNGGRDFGVILQRMTQMGYAVAWRLLNSRYYGVPQSRTRVYICCWKNSPTKAMRVMFDHLGAGDTRYERRGFITESNNPDIYPRVPLVSYCIAATTGRHTGTDWSRTYVVCADGVRRMTPIECERLQGFPDNWTLPNNNNNDVENDDINSQRYHAIGNAVSVPVVSWISRRIKKELTTSRPELDKQEIKNYVPEFANVNWSEQPLSEIDFSNEDIEYKWPYGGIAFDNSYICAKVRTAPHEPIITTLIDYIQQEQVDNQFYISANAAEGIVRRVDRAGRTLFGPLREALELLRQ